MSRLRSSTRFLGYRREYRRESTETLPLRLAAAAAAGGFIADLGAPASSFSSSDPALAKHRRALIKNVESTLRIKIQAESSRFYLNLTHNCKHYSACNFILSAD